MAKTVCVVGAGPSGLVAAKCFLHEFPEGAYNVTLYDSQPRLGGMWPRVRDEAGGLLHPLMLANQSRHTMQFSDLAWDPQAPQVPRAWQVGQYLHRYATKYLYQKADINLSTRVVKTELLACGRGWRVQTCSQSGEIKVKEFDHLVVAAGFFGKPHIPQSLQDSREEASIPVVHSSEYRDLERLLGKTNSDGGKVLVVGGQLSGVEMAATIATHLSTAVNSPGEPPVAHPEKYSVHHLIQRPAWIIPMMTTNEYGLGGTPFYPIDVTSANIGNRPEPFECKYGHWDPEKARSAHGRFQRVLGTDQSEYSAHLVIGEAEKDAGLYHAISDFYLDFVRSGAISVSSGRLQSLSGRVASVVPLRTSTDTEIKDVAAVVLATGFEATSSVSYLPAAVLEILQTAPGDLNDTFALAFHNTYHPAVPNLGFVGFYRAPYWGVMEGQARFVAELLAAGGPSSPSLRPAMRKAVEEDTGIEDTLRVRAAPGSLQPQFPMANCVAIVDRLAKTLGVPRLSHTRVLPKAGPNPMDIITPARYLSKRATAEQSAESRASLQALEMAVGDDTGRRKFVARAVFRSLLGTWRLQREVASKLATHPSGQFTGTAEFLLRQGTREGRAGGFAADVAADGDPGLEYLYVERGTFKARDGTWFPATQRYVWRWDDEKDAISVWFVKPDDRKRVDYLFHEVKFQPAVNYEANSDSGDSGCGMPLFGGWPAKGKHLCVEDMYDVEYLFTFKQVVLERIQLDYYVKGPKKDYTLTGWYSR